jgi:tetratricopeptide (TPR) repeat protein
MSIKLTLYRNGLIKKARRGFQGHPVATIILYGPNDRLATKVAVGIAHDQNESPKTVAWHASRGDIRQDGDAWEKIARYVRSHAVVSVVMPPEILGCPHQEGIDYPEGEVCQECPFWKDRPRPYGLDDRAEDDEDLAPRLPDRRSMEKTLSRLMAPTESTALQQAQNLMWDAWDETDRKRRVEMGRKALEISADCADAYVMLAEETAKTSAQALELYRQGVAAGERALGLQMFEEDAGKFWGILETRPYMRARAGLAEVLANEDQLDEAISHYQELLRLNPNDNQGNRTELLSCLLKANRNSEASELIDAYPDSILANWNYGAALVAFRMSGRGPRASELLAAALKANPHVPAYLLGERKVPRDSPAYFSPHAESEAVVYAQTYAESWKSTPGALEWLAADRLAVE